MKTVFLVLSSALFLIGCKSEEQTPRFGKPVSVIPWNEPTDWEKGGQFGSMPAFQQPH